MRFSTFIFAVLFLLTISIPAQTSVVDENEGLNPSTRDYDQLSILLDLKPDFKLGSFTGSSEFTFSPVSDNFSLLRLHSRYTKVSSVTDASGKSLKFESTGKLLKVFFPSRIPKGEITRIRIEFISTPGRGLYFFAPTSEYPYLPYQLWSQGQSDYNRCWYPAYDLPDDKLIVSVKCTVPAGFLVVSNGDLTERKSLPSGELTYSFMMQYPHSNYLTTLIAGNFREYTEQHKDVKLYTLFPYDWQGTGEDVVGRTASMLGFYSSYCMPYPFNSYTQTFVQDFEYGGMENTTATTLNRRVLHNKISAPQYSADELVSHEFAHQWFGDVITCREWKDIWLNEGFATYMTPLWKNFYYGEEEYFAEIINQQKGVLAKKDNVFIVNDTTENPGDLDGGFAYSKGSSILHSIRETIGDASFKNVIQKYLKQYAFQSVTSPDFLAVLEKESGVKFRTMFNQFVYGKGYPELRITINGQLNSGTFSIIVEQAQKGNLFTGSIPVLLGNKEKTVFSIYLKNKIDTFKVVNSSPVYYVRFNNRNSVLLRYQYKRPVSELVQQFNDCSDLTAVNDVLSTLEQDSVKDTEIFEEMYKTTLSKKVRTDIIELLTRNRILSSQVLGLALGSGIPEIRERGVGFLTLFAPNFARKTALTLLSTEQNEYVIAGLYRIFALNYTGEDSLLIKNGLSKASHQNCIRRAIFEGFTQKKNPAFLSYAADLFEYTNSYGDNHLLDFSIMDYAESVRELNPDLSKQIFLKGLNNFYFRTRVTSASLVSKYMGKEGKLHIADILKKEKRETVIKQLENYLKTSEPLREED